MTDAATPAKPLRAADADELDAHLDRYDTVLLDLYTEGCSLCAGLEPVLGTVAKVSDAAVVMVNPRDDPVLVERFDVRSVPTLVLFEDGEAVGRLAEGFQGVEAVLAFVERNSRRADATD